MPNSPERPLHAAVKTAMAADTVYPALLFYADFPGGAVRMWTGIGPLAVMGETWTGLGDLIGVEDVTESTDSAAQSLAVRLSGIPSTVFNPVMLGNYQNRRAEVWLCAMTADGAVIGDPYLLFSGLMDSDSIRDTGTEVSVTITVESAMSDQLKPRVFRYTHEDQQTLYPAANDKGFEFVAALQNVELRWG